MPLLRNTDKSKISKRNNPAARLTWFREQGYLPEALVNFLALLAYPPKEDGREVFTFDEFVADFDWAKVNPVGPIFDLDKLGWLNGHYIRSLECDELAARIVGHLSLTGVLDAEPTPAQVELIRAATPLVQERMQLLSESEGMLAFLLASDGDLVIQDDARAQLKDDAARVVDAAIPVLEALASWVAADIEAALRATLVDGLGIKPRIAFTPLRVGVTGRRISPPLFESMEILGRDSTLVRLRSLRASL